jgi:protein O-mannosyl-transferase
VPTVRDNPAIRQWSTAWGQWSVHGLTASGRPLVSLSLALNYAISGPQVWSYHAFNLAIHIFCGLTLFAIVRRTLANSSLSPVPQPEIVPGGVGPGAVSFALAAALLWTLHPLQTESVTYISQRAESMMGLFYLLTVYCFIRYASPSVHSRPVSSTVPGIADRTSGQRGWAFLSVLACLAGMATKEVMVSAPLVVWLYDRTFVSGGFGAALRGRWRYYAALTLTWILLGALTVANGDRGRTAGFNAGVNWWRYALAQFPALVRYLRLAIWPHPLVFDYGRNLDAPAGVIAAAGLAVAAMLIGTIVAIRRRPVRGFLGAWFFMILAPSSSVLPVATEIVAEHRMYLPLAAVVLLGLWALRRAPARIFLVLTFMLATGLGLATAQRNRTYQNELILWSDTARDRPENADAQYNLGKTLAEAGRIPEAASRYALAVQLQPDFAQAQTNLGSALDQLGRTDEAQAHFALAVRLRPDLVEAQNDFGNLLLRLGQSDEAIAHYQTALHWQPDYPLTHLNLGLALTQTQQLAAAAREFQTALRLKPDFPEAYFDLGNVLAEGGANAEAIACYEAALRYRPDYADARSNLDVVRTRLQNPGLKN